MAMKRFKRLYTEYPDKYWRVPYHNGRGPILIPIGLNRATIRRCRRGIPFECVLADGIVAYAREHPEAFPHPVLYAYVERTAIYLVDRFKDGQPGHGVRYGHSFTKLTEYFDKISEKQFVNEYDGHGFTLTLLSGRKFRGGEATTGGNGTGGSRSHIVSRGAMARAQAAGLIPSIGNA